jgi:hypothetical protein
MFYTISNSRNLSFKKWFGKIGGLSMATPAPCCKKALEDATARFPKRNKASDGIMGDVRHQKQKSDHNDGNAFDLTHDPANGVDCNILSRQVINDPRVTYVIWNREIYNRSRAAEGWRRYSGKNPHTKHMHVSIKATSRNDLAPWIWSVTGAAPPTASVAPPYPGKVLRVNSKGADVHVLQQRLKDLGRNIDVDGVFGAGTRAVIIAFQRENKLPDDGIVGKKTWAALWAK